MFRALPDEIGKLKNLLDLTLQSTALKSLPTSIGNLKNLYELVIFGFSSSETPAECNWSFDKFAGTQFGVFGNRKAP